MSHQPRCTALLVNLGPDAATDRVTTSAVSQQDVDLEVVVVRDSSLSPGARLNRAVSRCSTDHVVVINAVERVGPRFVRECLDALAATDAAPFAAMARTNLMGSWEGPKRALDVTDIVAGVWTILQTFVVRRDAIERVGGFDETLPALAEWELLLRVAEQLGAGVCINDPEAEGDLRCAGVGESLRPDWHLAAMRQILRRHGPTFSDRLVQSLVDRDRAATEMWKRERELGAQREELIAEYGRVDAALKGISGELRARGHQTLEWSDLRRTTPISRHWGLDRGRPIDRHYIERFIASHAADIRGEVLEVLNGQLTAMFGSDIRRADVLDIEPTNPRATVVADLRAAPGVPANTYDCFILTQTLHLIDDMQAVVREAHRMLKPGGVLLVTLPCVSMIAEEYGPRGDHWRVTPAGAKALFEPVFGAANVEVSAHGNVFAAAAFLFGLSCEDVVTEELEADDPAYPLVVTVRARKAGSGPLQRRAVTVPILLYHRIANLDRDTHQLAVREEHFREQLEELRLNWQPLKLSDVVVALREDRVPERAVVLTFDDGYADNLECAAPALSDARIPATFFLTTECDQAPRSFWWDVLEAALLSGDIDGSSITIRVDGSARSLAIHDADARTRTHAELYHLLRQASPALRDDLIRQIRRQVSSSFEIDGRAHAMPIEAVRQLAAMPWAEIGAHTVHHLSLSAVPRDQQFREIFESRSDLERRLGVPVELFAYPYGDAPAEAIDLVRAAGYVAACTCEPRAARTGDRLHALPRLQVPNVGGNAFGQWIASHV